MREFKKGSLGLLLLHLLYEQPGYGYDLCERLRLRTEGTLTFEDGAVYPLLHAYERDGLVEGYWQDEEERASGTAEARKGPRRRYYRLTPRGVSALKAALQEWHTFTSAVGHVLGEDAVARAAGSAEGKRA